VGLDEISEGKNGWRNRGGYHPADGIAEGGSANTST
jgi:hypothetical protein